MKNKFTFKKQPQETGLSAVGNPYPNTDIKHNKKVVGYIASPNWRTDDQWRIRLMVVEETGWKWITLKKTFGTEPECREFLNEHVEGILAKNLYHDPLD